MFIFLYFSVLIGLFIYSFIHLLIYLRADLWICVFIDKYRYLLYTYYMGLFFIWRYIYIYSYIYIDIHLYI